MARKTTKPALKTKKPAPSNKPTRATGKEQPDRAATLILGTRKGTLILRRGKDGWKAEPLGHPGVSVSYAARDPRTGVIWSALEHGHWGPKLSRSRDGGRTWEDAPQIKYPEGARYIDPFTEISQNKSRYKAASLMKIWVLGFGAESQPGRIYAGTIPGGLFVSNDGGESFELNLPLWNHESRGGDLFAGDGTGKSFWSGGGLGINGEHAAGIHSLVVDPRDPKRLLVGVSCAGVVETTDDGRTWRGLNDGLRMDYGPDPTPPWGHDVHFMALCPAQPDHLWQQNHFGVFYSSSGAKKWKIVSKKGALVHFGFPVAVDERDGKTAWVVPGRADDQRMAVDGALCVARTEDGGRTWKALRKGLPQKNAWDVVFRHALDIAGDCLAFGSTTGNLYFSRNRGESWECLGSNFPPIHSVRFA